MLAERPQCPARWGGDLHGFGVILRKNGRYAITFPDDRE